MRPSNPAAQGDVLTDRDGTVMLEFSPTEEFLVKHHDPLLASMGFDTAVTGFIKNMRTGSVIEELENNAIKVMNDNGVSATESGKIKSAQQFSDAVLNLIITETRLRSTLPYSFKGTLSFLQELVTVMPSPVAADAINYMSDSARKAIMSNTNNLLFAMVEANQAGSEVVCAATRSLLTNSGSAKSLLSETQGELGQDKLLQELVSLFRVDWYHPQPKASILRTHVSGDAVDKTQYMAAFADSVVEAREPRGIYANVRELAELALAFGGFTIDDTSVSNFFRLNAPIWQKNHLVSDAFDRFVAGEITGVREAVEDVIGTGKPSGFRGYMTEVDVNRAIARTDIWQPRPSRSQRSKRQRSSPAKQEILQERLTSDLLRQAEMPKEPRKLAVMRNGEVITFDTPQDAQGNRIKKQIQPFSVVSPDILYPSQPF